MFDGVPRNNGMPRISRHRAKISKVQFRIAGRSIGSVTRAITRAGPAPLLRAASSSEESVPASEECTIRYTIGVVMTAPSTDMPEIDDRFHTGRYRFWATTWVT